MTEPWHETPPVPRFGEPIGPWHRKFAWLPTWTFDIGCVWLRSVWRRRIQKHEYLYGGSDFWWQYRGIAP